MILPLFTGCPEKGANGQKGANGPYGNIPETHCIALWKEEGKLFLIDPSNSNFSSPLIEEIKIIFKTIIEDGERYDLDGIESWFENEGSWTNKASKIRVTN